MALTGSYLVTTKNVESFFNSLITAKAPPTFTLKFLENLGFKSTNDRLFIGVLKGLGFLDANGSPTERYYEFLDQGQSKRVLAEAIREAYGDLFAVNIKAQELPPQEVKNKLRTLTEGQNSDNVVGLMANTFKALVVYADWSMPSEARDEARERPESEAGEPESQGPSSRLTEEIPETTDAGQRSIRLHYNIQIHLPESRDVAVYDALFKSLRKHLL